jgi:hypothetical protein
MTAPIPIDERLKQAQIAKLQREIDLLPTSRWNFETVAKPIAAVLGLAAAGVALWVGVLKAQFELEEKTKKMDIIEAELVTKRKSVSELDIDLTQKVAAIKDKENVLASTKAQITEVQAALSKALTALALAQKSALPTDATSEIRQAQKPRVFVQFAGSIERRTIDGLRESLARGGFVAPPAERINRGQKNSVRYFVQTDNERKQAERLRDTTAEYFKTAGCPLQDIDVKFIDNSKPSPLEVWIMHNCSN